MRHSDITGKKFNRLLAINTAGIDKNGKMTWLFKCDCGKDHVQVGSNVSTGHIKSCGCLRVEKTIGRQLKDMTGQRFGRLVAIRRGGISGKNHRCVCKCDCGEEVEVLRDSLMSGGQRSCGCLKREIRGPKSPRWKHDKTTEERLINRSVPEKYQWRKAVLARDNRTCQLSGERDCPLAVHHIQSWDKYKELRFDPANGVTLSDRVHELFHSIYGRGSNTSEQYDVFARDMHIAYAAT